MPLQSWESIISVNNQRCRAAEANGVDGVFEPMEMKVGCYCYAQNCFGDKFGIGCWSGALSWQCRKKSDSIEEVEPSICHFGCCICAFDVEESKRYQISSALCMNEGKGTKTIKMAESKWEGGCSLYYDYVKNKLDNYAVQAFQQVDSHSEDEIIQVIITKKSIKIIHNSA